MGALSEIKCNVPEGKKRAVTAATTPHSEHHALQADEVEQVEPELGSMCPSTAAAFVCSFLFAESNSSAHFCPGAETWGTKLSHM